MARPVPVVGLVGGQVERAVDGQVQQVGGGRTENQEGRQQATAPGRRGIEDAGSAQRHQHEIGLRDADRTSRLHPGTPFVVGGSDGVKATTIRRLAASFCERWNQRSQKLAAERTIRRLSPSRIIRTVTETSPHDRMEGRSSSWPRRRAFSSRPPSTIPTAGRTSAPPSRRSAPTCRPAIAAWRATTSSS